MRMKTIALVGACSLAVTGLSAGAAFAGEVTGNGKSTPISTKANSPCAFSGLNDNLPGDGVVIPGEVQNFPQAVRDGEVVEVVRGASSTIVDIGLGFEFPYGCNARTFGMK